VFRLLRSSELVTPDRVRYVLRAQPMNATSANGSIEESREWDAELIRDKIAHRQAIPSAETTYEDLWQRLKLRLDVDPT